MKPNIFLITIDALRADYIYETESKYHPFLSSLMEKSLVFENSISPGPNTAYAFPGLLTDVSVMEVRKGDSKSNGIHSDATSLAERFKELGYFTAGFSNNAHLTRIQGYDKGFDHFYDGLGEDIKPSQSFNLKNKIVTYLEDSFDLKFRKGKHIIGPLLSLINERGYERAPSILQRIKEFLDNYSEDKPLFLWTHLMEVHSPYNLPSDLFPKIGEEKISNWERQWLRHKRHNADSFDGEYLTEDDMEKIKTLYRCGIRDVDDNLRDFFHYLTNNDFLENGCFTVTADHGENLGEHGLMTHNYIYNSVLKVPLLIYIGNEKDKTKGVFSNSKLGNFLLDFSKGIPIKERIKKYSGIAISERGSNTFSIQDENYKIIWEKNPEKKRFFKLKDGYEAEEIQDKFEQEILELESKLRHHISHVRSKEKSTIKKAISKDLLGKI